MNCDVVVLGAGAAGLMCAIGAGRRARSVVVVDHGGRAGRKILVSGGGRCNFTNANVEAGNYVSANPHFCKSVLARFTPRDFLSFVEGHGIAYEEREEGRIFCTGSSGLIVHMLLKECEAAGVKILPNRRISGITRDDCFRVITDTGEIRSESLVVATGGLSCPSLGATGIGYRIAAQFGLRTVLPRPALVPFTFSPRDRERFGELSGVSIDAGVRCDGNEFRGAVLFTHRGLSGPAILQTSLYWKPGKDIVLDLLPGLDVGNLLQSARRSKMEMKNLLARHLPRRLARTWCECSLPSKPLNQYTDKERAEASSLIAHWEVRPAGTEGYRTAEVTAGGVDTDGLSSKTLEARTVPGLYFAGEVVDVTGHLGGYNLHWAWASGWTAGQYA